MRRFSWFLILLVLFKLSLGSVMASSALAHLKHTEEQALAMPSCHGQANANLAQHSNDGLSLSHTKSDTTPHTPNDTQVDCHHCCALGLWGQTSLSGPPAPAVHAAPIQQDWLSVSLRPGLRPPIA